jgi:hypothetical protein
LSNPNTVSIVIPAPLCALALGPETHYSSLRPVHSALASSYCFHSLPWSYFPYTLLPAVYCRSRPCYSIPYRYPCQLFYLTVSCKTASCILFHKKQSHRATPSPRSDLSVAYIYPPEPPLLRSLVLCLVGLWLFWLVLHLFVSPRSTQLIGTHPHLYHHIQLHHDINHSATFSMAGV